MTRIKLSVREIAILKSAANGMGDKEIANELGLSIGTVRTYWTRIRTKQGASTRAQAVGIYMRSLSETPVAHSSDDIAALGRFFERRGHPAWEIEASGVIVRALNRKGEEFHQAILANAGNDAACWITEMEEHVQHAVFEAVEQAVISPKPQTTILPVAYQMGARGYASVFPGSVVGGTSVIVFFLN